MCVEMCVAGICGSMAASLVPPAKQMQCTFQGIPTGHSSAHVHDGCACQTQRLKWWLASVFIVHINISSPQDVIESAFGAFNGQREHGLMPHSHMPLPHIIQCMPITDV